VVGEGVEPWCYVGTDRRDLCNICKVMREVVDGGVRREGAHRREQLLEYWTVIKKNHREFNVTLSAKPEKISSSSRTYR